MATQGGPLLTRRPKHDCAGSGVAHAATVAARGAAQCDWLRAIDALSEPVFIHDRDYCILAANRAYARRAGSPPEHFLGRPYWEVFPRRDGPLPGCRNITENASDRLGCEEQCEEIQLSESEEVFVSRSFLIPDSAGYYNQAIHILEDVTEQRRRELQLEQAESRAREREHQLERVLGNTAEGILVVDQEGKVVYANHTAGRMIGAEPPSLVGELFGFPVSTGQPQEIELLSRHNGPLIVEMRARSLRWEGAPAWVINLHDVTERKRVERELRQAAIVFEAAREGVIIADTDANIVAVNRAFTQITGYTEEEVLGRNPRLLQSGYHSQAFYEAMWRAIHEQGAWTGELWNRRRDGTTYAELATIRELRDETGRRTHYIGVFSDISRIKEYQNQLERVLHIDPLTELPNRLLFNDRLEQSMRRGARTSDPGVAVLMLDINDFRAVNDSLGHAVGDRTLRIVGERLGAALPETATVARLSGDEFGILLPELATPDDAAAAAEALIAGAQAPLVIDGHEIPVQVRIGISTYPGQAQSANVLMEQADAAMYEAKSEGVGYRYFSEELTERARERVQIGADLRQAFAQDQLTLHYQPQVDLTSGRWTGLEALIRWEHPTEGMISPARFIPIAERAGLMTRLGAWVLERACQEHQQALAAGLDWGRVAVNITAPELAEPNFAERVLATLHQAGLPPERLELEITESLLVAVDERTIGHLEALRRHGVTVAVDDFGTGYSALSYLKDLPADRLKIDRSFIDSFGKEPRGTTITRAILALGQSLELAVIAEGIETDAQHRALREAGCEQGQGFLFQRPAPLPVLRGQTP